MNEIIQSLIKRKSVRVYTEQPICEEDKRLILEAAIQAPSAGNMQMYSILDITEQELKDKLSVLCDNQPFIAKAPMVLVFCADYQKWYDAFSLAGAKPRDCGVGDLMLAVTDTMIAAQNAVVAAESLGIGSCYIGDIIEEKEKVVELLQLPRYVMPVGMLVLGYPTTQQMEREKPTRPDISHIVMNNTYKRKDEAALRELFADKTAAIGFEQWMNAFCSRKYNSQFSQEMSRSVEAYLNEWR